MGGGKGAESLPVSDFVSPRGAIDLSSVVIGGRFALQLLVDGVATDVENLAGFALFQTIAFDRLNHFFCAGHSCTRWT